MSRKERQLYPDTRKAYTSAKSNSYRKADIELQQARLASIFGPEETARLDAEALPPPTQEQKDAWRKLAEDLRKHFNKDEGK
jgi:hypothetical protein